MRIPLLVPDARSTLARGVVAGLILGLSTGASASSPAPPKTRWVDATVDAGSTDNSLVVRVDAAARPDLDPADVRLVSMAPPRELRRIRVERLAEGADGPTFLVLFDVAAGAVAPELGPLEVVFRPEAEGTPYPRFDVDRIGLRLTIEPTRVTVAQPEPEVDTAPSDDFGGWGDAVTDAERETETRSRPPSRRAEPARSTPPRRPAPRVPDIAGQAAQTAERARADQARNRERVGGIIDAISTIADTFTRSRPGQPPVHAPVVPADQIPGLPAPSATPRGTGAPPGRAVPPATQGGQGQGGQGQREQGGSPGCVIFDQLNYGSDAHFLVKVESGRPRDAVGYYVVSVPARKSFAGGSSCSSGRSCLDLYLRQVVPGQRTQVLGSYRSRSGAAGAARRACPSPLNR